MHLAPFKERCTPIRFLPSTSFPTSFYRKTPFPTLDLGFCLNNSTAIRPQKVSSFIMVLSHFYPSPDLGFHFSFFRFLFPLLQIQGFGTISCFFFSRFQVKEELIYLPRFAITKCFYFILFKWVLCSLISKQCKPLLVHIA